MKFLRNLHVFLGPLKGKYLFIVISLVLIGLALLFFYDTFLVLLFIAVGSLSLIHTIFTKNYIGFELCTLVTVISSMQYGMATGILVGITSITLGLILGRSVNTGIFVSMAGFALIAIIASFFSLNQIVIVGIFLTILYDILLAVFYYFSGSNPFTILSFSISHVIINFFIFSYLTPIFLGLM